jgi:hypothetical protein
VEREKEREREEERKLLMLISKNLMYQKKGKYTI